MVVLAAALVLSAVPTGVFATATVATSNAPAATEIYWGNLGGNASIAKAKTDNSGGSDVPVGITGPQGMAIDGVNGLIYWAASYESGGPALRRANLDGTGSVLVSHTGASMGSAPFGVAIYPGANKIYWANLDLNKISMANLDGSGGGSDLITTGATVDDPNGVAVDPGAGKIYWANSVAFGSPDPARISWANLDGSGGGDLDTGLATLNEPHGVALDTAAGKIYWANNADNKISWANLDGSGGGDLNTTGATVSTPDGVAVDPVAGRIYWANFNVNSIAWANLDGSGGADLNTTGADIGAPLFPTLPDEPPETTIDSGPMGPTSETSPSFTFSSDEAGSTFECRLDAETFASCMSPKSYTALADGPHTFEVRATDPAGNTDPSPAMRAFTIDPADTTPPETMIDVGPNGPTNQSSPSFTFSSDEAGSTFECRLDPEVFAPCVSPKDYTSVADGPYTFEVRATDPAGNTDPSPAASAFTVDTVVAGKATAKKKRRFKCRKRRKSPFRVKVTVSAQESLSVVVNGRRRSLDAGTSWTKTLKKKVRKNRRKASIRVKVTMTDDLGNLKKMNRRIKSKSRRCR